MKSYQYPRLPDGEYQRLMSDYKKAVGKILSSCFKMHGMDVFIPGATEAIYKVGDQLGMALRGKPNQKIEAPEIGRYNADD